MSNTNTWNDSDFHLPYNRQLVEKAKELRTHLRSGLRRGAKMRKCDRESVAEVELCDRLFTCLTRKR